MKVQEAEQAVIGALLLDNSALCRVPDLLPEHFLLDDHRIIFSEVSKMINDGKPVDVITLSDSFGKQGIDKEIRDYAVDIAINTPSAHLVKHYAEIVIDDALRRSLSSMTAQLAEETLSDKCTPASQMLEKIQSAVMGLSAKKTSKEPALARVAMVSHIDAVSERAEGKTVSVSTGFGKIDYMLNGGMNRSDMIVIGARPSMGKTAWALNIAAHVAKTGKVLFLSQEMGTGQILDRLAASQGKVDLSAILKGEMTQEQWTGYTAACAAIESMSLFIDDQGGLTINDVRLKARRIKQQHGLDLLVVDYLQLMSATGTNRNAQIEEISRGLKNLAKELDIVVIVLSQLNREVDKRPGRRPVLSDLRDSGSIEQDADIIIFLHRDEVNNPESPMKGYADVMIAKNRQGRIGDVLLRYHGEYTLFESTTESRPTTQQHKRKGLAEHL